MLFSRDSEDGNSAAKYVLIAAGAAGAIVLGRLLPVVFANVGGAIRGAAGQDPFKGLIGEHRELLSLLTKMESTPAENPVKRMALFLRFKRTIGKHALAEEDIIYPWLQNDAERKEATEKLYQEHASMKVHLFELQRSIHDEQGWRTHVRALRAEIEPHARQEEEIEFPKLRTLLSKKQSVELSRKIDQEESLLA